MVELRLWRWLKTSNKSSVPDPEDPRPLQPVAHEPKKGNHPVSLVPARPDYPVASAAYFLSAALSRRASCSSCFQRQAVFNAAMDDGDIIERTAVEMIKR